jgi:hypothetical protein
MSDASKIALLMNGTIDVMGHRSVQAPTSAKTSLFKIDHFSKQTAGYCRAVLMSNPGHSCRFGVRFECPLLLHKRRFRPEEARAFFVVPRQQMGRDHTSSEGGVFCEGCRYSQRGLEPLMRLGRVYECEYGVFPHSEFVRYLNSLRFQCGSSPGTKPKIDFDSAWFFSEIVPTRAGWNQISPARGAAFILASTAPL